MIKQYDGICTAIALYDVKKSDLIGLFEFMENWVVIKGYEPKRAGIYTAINMPRKTKTFKYVKRTLLGGIDEEFIGFWFASYKTDVIDSDMFDAIVTTSLDLHKFNRFYLCFHHDIVPFVREEVEQLIKDICQFINPGYGIVFHRDWNRGPGLYVDGINTNCPIPDFKMTPELEAIENRDRELNSKWWKSYAMGKYTPGQLRDIYTMNILSKVHLEQKIFDTNLKNWIESSPNHGELKPLTDDLWEWWIDEDKISSIRELLSPSGIIICI